MAPTNGAANAGADSSSSTGSGGNGNGNGSSGGSSSSTLKKGPWTAAEDAILLEYVQKHGEGNWNAVQKNSGLSRCGKSCRLRWANHLRPNLKKGSFSPEEERLILELHAKLGNKWARMAAQLPGRTDNEIKNYWNTRIKRRQRAGLPLYPPEIQRQAAFTHPHHHHHHRHSSSPSPNSSSSSSSSPSTLPLSPSPPLPIPSLPLHKPHFHGPLSSFDPMSFPASMPPLLSRHHHHQFLPQPSLNHRFKQFPDNAVASAPMFPLPFSSPLPSSSAPPLFPQNLHSQELPLPLQQQNYQFSMADFDLNPPILQPTTFEGDGLLPVASISMKLELPSSQVPGSAVATPELMHDEYKNSMACSASLARSNSGLLDALLQEAQEMAESNDLHKEALQQGPNGGMQGMDGCVDDCNQSRTVFHEGGTTSLGSTGQWDDSCSGHSPIGITMKEEEPMDKINSVDEDLCNLLDIIPASMPIVSEWYSDSGEVSHGQSGVTDEENGLGAQPPASTFTVTADHDWTVESCHWNNMPGIC